MKQLILIMSTLIFIILFTSLTFNDSKPIDIYLPGEVISVNFSNRNVYSNLNIDTTFNSDSELRSWLSNYTMERSLYIEETSLDDFAARAEISINKITNECILSISDSSNDWWDYSKSTYQCDGFNCIYR